MTYRQPHMIHTTRHTPPYISMHPHNMWAILYLYAHGWWPLSQGVIREKGEVSYERGRSVDCLSNTIICVTQSSCDARKKTKYKYDIQLIQKMPLPVYPQTSFTRQANCHLACQETADIVWKTPLVPVPFHMNQVHILTLHSLKFYFNIVFPSFPFRFFSRKYHLYLFHVYYLLHKYHPPRFCYPNILLYRVATSYESPKQLMKFSPVSGFFLRITIMIKM